MTVYTLTEQVDAAVHIAVMLSYLEQDTSAPTEVSHGFLSPLEQMPVLIRPRPLPFQFTIHQPSRY